jgi:hypothetical protein
MHVAPKFLRLLAAVLFLGLRLYSTGQEFMADQANGSINDPPVVSGLPLPGSIAQSFTPLLPSVDFIQVDIYLLTSDPQTFYFNLRANDPNSPIFASTVPVVLSNRSNKKELFYFPNSVSLIPGNVYFFEPVDASNGRMSIGYLSPSGYTRGDLWSNGGKDPDADLWFREGVIVPEPSAAILVGLGGLILLFRQGGQRHDRS